MRHKEECRSTARLHRADFFNGDCYFLSILSCFKYNPASEAANEIRPLSMIFKSYGFLN